MVANHTSVAHLFRRTLKQFDSLYTRQAYLDNYRRQPIFADGYEEFDDAREIVQSLADEYKAAESPDYVEWASGGGRLSGIGASAGAATGGGGRAESAEPTSSLYAGVGLGSGLGSGSRAGDASDSRAPTMGESAAVRGESGRATDGVSDARMPTEESSRHGDAGDARTKKAAAAGRGAAGSSFSGDDDFARAEREAGYGAGGDGYEEDSFRGSMADDGRGYGGEDGGEFES